MASARQLKKSRRKNNKQPDRIFHAGFDASQLPPNDRALQALKAHTEFELSSDHQGQTIYDASASPASISAKLGVTQKTPLVFKGMNYHWQHHVTNLLFCIVFIGLGFMLSEIRQIIKADTIAELVQKKTKQLAGASDSNALTFTVTASEVNVRQGPGVRYDIVDKLKQGTVVNGHIVDDKWVQLAINRFVYRPALKLSTQVPAPKKLESFWTVLPHTEVFREAAEKSGRLRQLGYGEEVQGQVQGDWLVLESNQGYLKLSELSRERPFHLDGEATLARIRTAKAPIRMGPDRSHKLVGVFFEGKIVKVLDLQKGWAKIGEEQFLPAFYLQSMPAKSFSASQQQRDDSQQTR